MKNQEKDTHSTMLRLPNHLWIEIGEYTLHSGMTFTEFVRRACREKLDRAAAAGDADAAAPLTREEVQKMINDAVHGHTVTQTNTGAGANQSVKIER